MNRDLIGSPVEDLDTPALLLDGPASDRNIRRMADFFPGRKCRLRPHFKNHKCASLARRQQEAGSTVGITCAKLGEAEVLADGGIENVLIANQVVGPRKIARLVELAGKIEVAVAVDDVAQGEAIETVGAIARELAPEGSGYRVLLAGNSEKFVESGNALAFAYGLAILIVYLVLAAQFESFVHPLTILVAVALSFTGALVTLAIVGWLNDRGVVQVVGSLNIYSKIGLVMLIGLVTKNSILIVEFANQLRGRGYALVDATVEAARTRFRPILMTALATMVGILPIALGQGAGGDARAPLGIAVVGGMFFSTGLTFLVVPAAYVVMERAQLRLRGRAVEPEANPTTLRTA
jgi:multidrug efflux pump